MPLPKLQIVWLAVTIKKLYWMDNRLHQIFNLTAHSIKQLKTLFMLYLQLVLEVLSVVSALCRWLYSSCAKYNLCCFTSYISFFACNKKTYFTAPTGHGSYAKCSTPNLRNGADFSSTTHHHLHENVVLLSRWSQPNLLLPQENNVISICTIDFYGKWKLSGLET